MRQGRMSTICLVVLLLLLGETVSAQTPAQARIHGPINNADRTVLRGNTHPLARPEFDEGAAPPDLPAQRMLMLLSRAPEQQAALDKFLEEQQDRSSPNYMHWLTPAEFGQKFGPANADVSAVTNWLAQQGFTIEGVSAGKTAIEFSGTAARVQQAFHTSIHQYLINGQQYWANAQDPQIPAALAPVVRGVVSLNDFPRKRLSRRLGVFTRQSDGSVTPAYTVSNGSGTYYAVGPGDFATIYNTNPLLQAGNNGAGQTIAVLGLSNVHLTDIASFRTLFNLGAGNTSVVLDGPDPGIVQGDEGESVLDLEWSGAVAPGAKLVLVSAQDTFTTSGLELAALHAIDSNLAGVISLSYGYCEQYLGTTENQYLQSLWQQAAAQGITVLVSTGDSGSAGCDYQSATAIAQNGLGVNGFASTAYNVAVGGTDFNDAGSQATYWSTTNDATTHASAKGYIPEMTWNITCAASAAVGNLSVCPAMPASGSPPPGLELAAAGGGRSSCAVSMSSGGTVQCQSGRAKPTWQTGPGVPRDGVRDVPDVSLFAAASSSSRSFYIVCESDTSYGPMCQPGSSFSFLGVGGTSASAAAFAGIVALAEQKAGTRLGNLNPLLYSLAAQTGASCRTGAGGTSCMFNDVVSGNISVPCTAGTPNCSATSGTASGVEVDSTGAPAYAAGTGYDLATGLGTVNVANLVNGIVNAVKNASATSVALTLNGSTTAVTAQHGNSIDVAVSLTPSGSSGTVSLVGNAAGIDSAALSSGSATWSSRKFPGGNYTVTAHYPGDPTHAASDSNGVAVTISPEASQTLVNLVTFDANGVATNNATTAAYGSPYILRGAVADTAATVSAASGVSSTCSNGTASCATGNVNLTSNGSPLDGGSFVLNSKGFFEDWQIQLPAGSYNVAATYAGDPSYSASTGTSAVTITKAATSLTASTSATGALQYGVPVTVAAQVSTNSSGVAPGGTYTWVEDGSATNDVINGYTIGTAGDSSTTAKATYNGSYIPPSIGTHTMYAKYSGDANYLASDSSASPFTVTVGKAATSALGTVSPINALATTQVTLTVSVSTQSRLAEPTGTVTFYDNGNPVGGTVSYSGSAGNGLYSPAVLQASVTGTFSVGSHTITASYSGDGDYTGFTTQQVGTLTVYDKFPTALSINAELNPTVVNYATKLTASVAPTAYSGAPGMTGTVAFFDNGQPLTGAITYNSSPNLAYTATLSVTFTASGSHSITATYSGDGNYASSDNLKTPMALKVVDKLPTTVSFYGGTASVGNPVVFQASVFGASYSGPVMSGTVTFMDGGTQMAGTVQMTASPGSIHATLSYTFTTAGTHNITVQYSGDNYYAASQTTPLAWDVLGPLAVRFASPSMLVSRTGGNSNALLTVFNNTSSAMTVSLTCTPDASAATCSMAPNPVTVNASTNYAVTVTIGVPALTASSKRGAPFTMPFVLAGVLMGLPLMTRRRRALMLAGIAIALVVALTSCGGGGSGSSFQSSGGTTTTVTSKTYKFTVTATSGSYTDSQVLTVTQQ